MTGAIRTTKRLFGMSPGNRGESYASEGVLGKNRDRNAYYGNAADVLRTQKHGARKYARYVRGLGAVRGHGHLDSLPSASGQLLGGGG